MSHKHNSGESIRKDTVLLLHFSPRVKACTTKVAVTIWDHQLLQSTRNKVIKWLNNSGEGDKDGESVIL